MSDDIVERLRAFGVEGFPLALDGADEIERLRAALLSIADAARQSPYRDQGLWDDPLAKLIARSVEYIAARKGEA